ncbi:DUF4365 domain-containing protein [Acetobacter senegalensis]|uniref:DUF4365 domain-containing protein n=1 Tax=Acetobacter senegalensis TaxID=446692 RepID=UPI001ED9C8A7|nr:DUF4365 domain-containing protein [Acetobacter senegalensis]MCG4261179.1 DUF4365 domain-containing protein [Acetobacter senegalensis]
MKFHYRDKIGKSGERFLEAFVEEELGFTYRKVGPPDIGVDGEIETLDAARSSTGGFLKVQVKTTEESYVNRPVKIALDEEHLDYFSSLTVPPILVAISLKDQAIWWKPILGKDNYRGPRGGFGVSFDPIQDRLTRSSRALIRLMAERSNGIIAKYILEEANETLDEMESEIESNEFDIVAVDIWGHQMQRIDRAMKDVSCLLRYERRITDEILAVKDGFEEIKERISERKIWFSKYNVDDLLTMDRGDTPY